MRNIFPLAVIAAHNGRAVYGMVPLLGITIHIVACEEKGPVDRVLFLPPKPTPHLGQRAHAPQPTPRPSLFLCAPAEAEEEEGE